MVMVMMAPVGMMVVVGTSIFLMIVPMPMIVTLAIRLVLVIMPLLITTQLHGLLKIFWSMGMIVVVTECPLIK